MSIKNRDMKTDMNRSQKKLDVFWDDCIKEDPFTNNTSFKFTKKNSNNSTNKSKNKKKLIIKEKYLKNVDEAWSMFVIKSYVKKSQIYMKKNKVIFRKIKKFKIQ